MELLEYKKATHLVGLEDDIAVRESIYGVPQASRGCPLIRCGEDNDFGGYQAAKNPFGL
jgi:hypothetical protein